MFNRGSMFVLMNKIEILGNPQREYNDKAELVSIYKHSFKLANIINN